MSGKKFRIIGVFWVAGLVSFFRAGPAHGFGAFDSTPPNAAWADLFADLLANPNQFDSWDPDTPGGIVITLTYMFDSSFTTNESIRDQVRLGIQQWDDANITPYGGTYSYLRNTGYQNFYDIRDTTVHELGHNLGFAHPFDVAPLGRNYDLIPPSVLVAVPDRGDECMSYGTMAGGYNQILSHDELNAFNYCYANKDINFVEITSGTPNILLSAQMMGGLILGYGPSTTVPRDPADLTQGSRITSAQIIFGADAIIPLGFRTLGQNWDVRNTSGKATRGIEIQTRGTNNPNPIGHFDGDPDGYRFDSFSTVSTGDADHKDDLLHTWSNPHFWTAAVDDIPAGNLHHIGLEQDVWDWTVVSARAVNEDFTKTYVPLVSFSQWNETVTGVDVTTSTSGIVLPDHPPEIVGGGIRIVNTEDTACDLVEIGVAVVDGRSLGLPDLNRDTLDQLIDDGIFEEFDIEPRMLDYGEELFLVLAGSPTGISNTIPLDRPDLLNHELFVYAETSTLDATVGNFALLGAQPILPWAVPEPSTLVLATFGLLVLLGYTWRRGRRGR
jgi:hypothetical protein